MLPRIQGYGATAGYGPPREYARCLRTRVRYMGGSPVGMSGRGRQDLEGDLILVNYLFILGLWEVSGGISLVGVEYVPCFALWGKEGGTEGWGGRPRG